MGDLHRMGELDSGGTVQSPQNSDCRKAEDTASESLTKDLCLEKVLNRTECLSQEFGCCLPGNREPQKVFKVASVALLGQYLNAVIEDELEVGTAEDRTDSVNSHEILISSVN